LTENKFMIRGEAFFVAFGLVEKGEKKRENLTKKSKKSSGGPARGSWNRLCSKTKGRKKRYYHENKKEKKKKKSEGVMG